MGKRAVIHRGAICHLLSDNMIALPHPRPITAAGHRSQQPLTHSGMATSQKTASYNLAPENLQGKGQMGKGVTLTKAFEAPSIPACHMHLPKYPKMSRLSW